MPCHRNRVSLLDRVGQAEELPRGSADALGQCRVDAMPGDEDEACALQTFVDGRGHPVGRRAALVPVRDVYGGDHSVTPMSSFHSFGFATMNSSIIVTHR